MLVTKSCPGVIFYKTNAIQSETIFKRDVASHIA